MDPPTQVIYNQKRVEGFLVMGHDNSYLKSGGPLAFLLKFGAAKKAVADGLAPGGWVRAPPPSVDP